MHEISINPITLDRLEAVISTERLGEFRRNIPEAFELLRGRTVWNVNSTGKGGGVAEMLQPMLAYVRGIGIDARWLVIEADAEFFSITKRIHNLMHGSSSGDKELGSAQRRHYGATLAANANQLLTHVRPQDVVICHDPQTAGLVPHLLNKTAAVIWRCHIGPDEPNQEVTQAWRFLLPYLTNCPAIVFSRATFIPPELNNESSVIIPPSIDPLSAKNQAMTPEVVRAILVKTGIIEGPMGTGRPCFIREDGSTGLVERCADTLHLGRPPAFDRRLVVQVARWDDLKDPVGVLVAFARYLAKDSASLVLAGPNVTAVADDPDGGRVLDDVHRAWRELPHEIRKHVHIACLPMTDSEENAAIVNALQRHAAVVVQKSLHEGFGLTVTEAMWKARPVVATAVGGIQDQIEHEVHGLLLEDPTDLDAFAQAVERLLNDHNLAERVACNARRRVEDKYLFTRHLLQYLKLFERVLG